MPCEWTSVFELSGSAFNLIYGLVWNLIERVTDCRSSPAAFARIAIFVIKFAQPNSVLVFSFYTPGDVHRNRFPWYILTSFLRERTAVKEPVVPLAFFISSLWLDLLQDSHTKCSILNRKWAQVVLTRRRDASHDFFLSFGFSPFSPFHSYSMIRFFVAISSRVDYKSNTWSWCISA